MEQFLKLLCTPVTNILRTSISCSNLLIRLKTLKKSYEVEYLQANVCRDLTSSNKVSLWSSCVCSKNPTCCPNQGKKGRNRA